MHEIHSRLEGEDEHGSGRAVTSFAGVLLQIAVLDIVFSLDSVITAVGMADDVSVMVIAIVLSVLVMMFAAKPIGEFVDRHPTSRCWRCRFLLLIGMTLIAEGFEPAHSKGLHLLRDGVLGLSRC